LRELTVTFSRVEIRLCGHCDRVSDGI
jgi:hypothetical protein